MENKHKFENYCKYKTSYVFSTKDREENAKNVLKKLSENIDISDELIVINGGEDRGLGNFVNNLKIKNCKYINEKDYSDIEAWNKSFLLSEGEIIKNICDDDDYNWLDLKKSIKILIDNSELDCIFTGGIKINTLTNQKSFINLPNNVLNWSSDINNLFKYSISGTGIVFKRRIFAKIESLWSQPVNELDFLIKCFNNRHVQIAYIRANTYTHYFNSNSVSSKNSDLKERYMIKKCYENCNFLFFIIFYLKRHKFMKLLTKLIFRKKDKKKLSNFDWSIS